MIFGVVTLYSEANGHLGYWKWCKILWNFASQFEWSYLINKSLTHWGRVTHICVSKLTIIASDNGLSPGRRQAIIWNNDGILLIWPLGTSFSEILIKINSFSFKKMDLKMSSGKWRPCCLGLNVLMTGCHTIEYMQDKWILIFQELRFQLTTPRKMIDIFLKTI